MIDLKLFDTAKAEKELKKICKEHNIPVTAISIILNNMNIYNLFVEDYLSGGSTSVHVLFQISGSIFKELIEFKLTPKKVEKKIEEEDSKLDYIKKKIEKRN